jgi:hypothetical protein
MREEMKTVREKKKRSDERKRVGRNRTEEKCVKKQ